MKTIKIRVRTNERNNVAYYRTFRVVEKLPQLDADYKQYGGYYEINEIAKDCEQPTEEAYLAECYEVKLFCVDDYENALECDMTEAEAIEEATEILYVAIIPNVEQLD